MRKVYWTVLAFLALPFIAMHACGGDDSNPPGSAGSKGSGGSTGTTTSTTTTSTTTGMAGR